MVVCTELSTYKWGDGELADMDNMVPCDVLKKPRTDVGHLPKWELDYVSSMCPQATR